MTPGSEAPAFLRGKPGQLVLGWAVDESDLVRCETQAYELRHVQRQYGSRVKIAAVVAGADSGLVRAFLRTERLPAELVFLDRREFRRRFGAEGQPRVYLVRDGRVADVIRPPQVGDRTQYRTWLEQPVRQALSD